MLLSVIPLTLVVSYLSITIAVFFFGPFDWPINNQNSLLIFLTGVFLAIFFGYLFGAGANKIGEQRYSSKALDWRRVFKIGITASLVIFIPATYIYTGKLPWQVFEVFQNQGAAYSAMLENIAQGSADRTIVAIFRTVFFPWMFAIIPIIILNWKNINRRYVIMFIIFLLSQITFSLMRGTDKEIADLLIITSASLLVKYGRLIQEKKFDIKFGKVILVTAGIFIILYIAFSLFSERKLSRLGTLNEFCIAETAVVCADYSGPILSSVNDDNKFGLAMLSSYLSQGYYGLSIALDESFESTYGLGHSPVLMSIYLDVTGDQSLYERSYLYKMRNHGWDDSGVWSSIFPWIASDVGFVGTLLIICFFSYLFSKTWIESVKYENDYAAMVFVSLFVFFMYIPANNQLAQTADSYYSFWFWIILWILSTKKIIYSRAG